jgi:hypothetical protein
VSLSQRRHVRADRGHRPSGPHQPGGWHGGWLADRPRSWRMIALGKNPELVRLAAECLARRWCLDPRAVRVLPLDEVPRAAEAGDERLLPSGHRPAGYGRPVVRKLVWSSSTRNERE